MSKSTSKQKVPEGKIPPFRKLRGYAFDPSLSLKIDTAFINNMVYKVEWERKLKPGPIGEYLEVIDYDPTVDKFYKPVNLNDEFILAQDGLEPSESNPQFHQQMVYAVAMTTIKNFERALGRPILWANRRTKDNTFEDILQLRIYPHAFRDANAYYSSQKKALLFGYFNAQPADVTVMMPEHQVFTCLSHDIIAHEVTHAILDGIYNRYIEDTNPDTLAFHEAFADIVALFQHFTFPEVLKHQIAKTRGDLASQNLLGQLAQEFGSAIGSYGALRDAIGEVNPTTQKWSIKEPKGDEYQTIFEAHERGSILVAAVFEAFINIYKVRVADLLRIATNGTGILPQGELHPDLVNRLATEASKVAGHVLKMCIRALDYCPPVDINFGDYLRAIITADSDLVSDDDRDYRLAFIDAFRRRGIYPSSIKSLSVESLCYSKCTFTNNRVIKTLVNFLRDFSKEISYAGNRKNINTITKKFIVSDKEENISGTQGLGLFARLNIKMDNSSEFQKMTGLCFNSYWDSLGIQTSHAYKDKQPGPRYTIHSLKYAARVGPSGNKVNQVIVTLIQHAGVEIVEKDGMEPEVKPFVQDAKFIPSETQFRFDGGVTLIFDLDTQEMKYSISKPLVDTETLQHLDKKRVLAQYNYYNEARQTQGHYKANFGLGRQFRGLEPFNFLHSH